LIQKDERYKLYAPLFKGSEMTTSTAPKLTESQTVKLAGSTQSQTAAKASTKRAQRNTTSTPAPRKATVKSATQPAKTTAAKKSVTSPMTDKTVTTKVNPARAQGKKPETTPPAKTKTATPKTKVIKTKTIKPLKVEKEKKVKVVRDSFTIPKIEFMQLAEMKKRALGLGVEVKKSELIRAGLQLLTGLQDAAFKKALSAVPTIKTGRPGKD
jgi:hypothetical protein